MKQDFADIYSKWESTHDETKAINKKTQAEETRYVSPTVSELRKMSVQDSLDLHQKTKDDAMVRTNSFIDLSFQKKLRKIRIVTGKGLHSPNGEAVLRPAVIEAVRANRNVREVDTNPPASEGGSGALIIILKENK